jgi:DNA-binding beta-propeller fold protein YncE
VLQQSGEATYPVCILNKVRIANGFVAVKFKTVSGREDQAAGLVWRARDTDNYYIARANALEDNVTIYTTIAGNRTEKKRAEIKVSPGVWHTLRVDFEGKQFSVAFDGKPALGWQDETFSDAGAVGVWTKADSRTLFDDFTYEMALQPGVSADGATPLELIDTIPLPGVQGRFDHFACDKAGGRLFVAALANNTLEVIDIEHSKHLQSVSGLRKPTGVLFAPNTGCIQVANGDDGSVRAYRTDTRELVTRLQGLDDADNMRFDATARLVYVGYGDGALAVVDSALGRLIGSIALPGHPEAFELEQRGKRLFVNVPDAHEVTVVDRDQRRVIAHWPMGKFAGNFPMALDENTHRLFVGCRNPPRLIVIDTANGRTVADVDISGDTDDLFCDPKRERLYISCGEGFLDIMQWKDHDHYERLARQPTRDGARTSYFARELDRLFLAAPKRGTLDAEVRVYRPR